MSVASVGMIHTVPALAASFSELLEPRMPGACVLQIVDAELLASAIRSGVTADIEARVCAHVRYLASAGCSAVLVTCSSIGETVAVAARTVDIPVLRIDDAMTDEAVLLVRRGEDAREIVVLATLEATLGPSVRLLESKTANSDVRVSSRVVAGAAAARASGDQALHDKLIAAAVRSEAKRAGVILLAQASMAAAASAVATSVPVLTSPAAAVAALARAVGTK